MPLNVLFFSVAKTQVTIVTSLSEEYCCCYKLYQIIHTTHSFFQLCTCSGTCLLYSLLCHVIQFFLYFTLTKDSVNVTVYMTCLYLLLFKKKKNDPYASMGKKTKIMPHLPCYLSFLPSCMLPSIVHAPPSFSFIPLSVVLSHYVPYPVSPVFLTAYELLQDKKLHCPWKGC